MKGELVIITIEKDLIDRARAAGLHSLHTEASRDELIAAVLAAAPVGLKVLLGEGYDLNADPTARIATFVTVDVAFEARRVLGMREREVSDKRGYCSGSYPFTVPEGTPFEEDHYVCNLIAGHQGDCEWVLPAKRAKIPGAVVTVMR